MTDLRARRAPLLPTLIALFLTACAPFNPPNQPIDHIDREYGYRPSDPSRQREPGEILLFVAFSGGGTRAAAFAYGVLEGLRDTEVVIDGKRVRLIDEVDSLSGVSGGSFPAAYYGLFGDRVFDEFEERFLKKNVQRALALRVLNPWNTVRLMTPALSRSDIASRYYDDHVFDHATFGDLANVRGPRVFINATDLPSGTPVRFSQDGFDLICSDLTPFKVSYAVAASSAVPVLLSPITLRNYAGRCGYEPPPWFDQALASRESNPRGYRAAAQQLPFLDAQKKKYIHLVDGGISDNLGVRLPLDRIAEMGGIKKTFREVDVLPPQHLLLIIVNAETDPSPLIDLKSSAPGLAASMNLVSGSQIRRYNFESLMLARSMVEDFGRQLSTPERPVDGRMVEVSFDLLPNPDDLSYFKQLPTSFKLSEEEVDRLIEAGRTILLESKQFRELVDSMQ